MQTKPGRGSTTPWGITEVAKTYTDGIVYVVAETGGGFWIDATRQATLPDAIQPRHGRCWFEQNTEEWVLFLAFEDMPHREMFMSSATRTLKEAFPAWLEALQREGLAIA